MINRERAPVFSICKLIGALKSARPTNRECLPAICIISRERVEPIYRDAMGRFRELKQAQYTTGSCDGYRNAITINVINFNSRETTPETSPYLNKWFKCLQNCRLRCCYCLSVICRHLRRRRGRGKFPIGISTVNGVVVINTKSKPNISRCICLETKIIKCILNASNGA